MPASARGDQWRGRGTDSLSEWPEQSIVSNGRWDMGQTHPKGRDEVVDALRGRAERSTWCGGVDIVEVVERSKDGGEDGGEASELKEEGEQTFFTRQRGRWDARGRQVAGLTAGRVISLYTDVAPPRRGRARTHRLIRLRLCLACAPRAGGGGYGSWCVPVPLEDAAA